MPVAALPRHSIRQYIPYPDFDIGRGDYLRNSKFADQSWYLITDNYIIII
jgi:hypothetical protein